MNRRNFITTAILAIPTIAMGLPMSLPTTPNSAKKYKYDFTHKYDWNDTIEIFSNKCLEIHGVKTMDYCASIIDKKGNIYGIDDVSFNLGENEPFVVKMHVLDSLPCNDRDNETIDLIPALNEIKEKMEVVTQTIWLRDKTIDKMVPFVRGLSKKTYNRMVGMMNATTKEEAEEILRKYE